MSIKRITMEKAIAKLNNAEGYERFILTSSLWRGPNSTREVFSVMIDGQFDEVEPTCKPSIASFANYLEWCAKNLA